MLVLGHHLATELGFSDSCDTLGKWMSHYLVEVMERAEHAENPEEKEKYQQQSVELILKLWGHRRNMTNNAYPLARFKKIIESLSILSPEANVWERNKLGKYESLAADTFSMIVDLYRALHFVEFTTLKLYRGNQVPPSVLTVEEQELYDFLLSWAEEEMNFRSANDLLTEKSEVQHMSKFLSDYIDDLCKKLQKLKEELPNS
ncbi:hypothetical protein VF_A0704 [Aliivibrio fischeri ES114]|uniref:Uncharacterized protein n=2 Tax=Aliivibrio fischeri TaxID=668 RepID=Q5DZM2_ALIF1|nr:hypothetical protein VF_A0704 [Aliivibrio fischeri ES114]KLU80265.1 hypothetical protein AB192_00095 [Aliivibrio fischeri]